MYPAADVMVTVQITRQLDEFMLRGSHVAINICLGTTRVLVKDEIARLQQETSVH